jgi:hypothetical protein
MHAAEPGMHCIPGKGRTAHSFPITERGNPSHEYSRRWPAHTVGSHPQPRPTLQRVPRGSPHHSPERRPDREARDPRGPTLRSLATALAAPCEYDQGPGDTPHAGLLNPTRQTSIRAPGVDGVSFGQIEERGLEAWLTGLREELVSKTYQPDAVRRVAIRKSGGGERLLGIPRHTGHYAPHSVCVGGDPT